MSKTLEKPGVFDWDRVFTKAEQGDFFPDTWIVPTRKPAKEGQQEQTTREKQG